MEIIKIYWTKTYCEDLGEQDQEGFYDYAYRYYIYEFKLRNIGTLIARRYLDTLHKCSFLNIDYLKGKRMSGRLDNNFPYDLTHIGTIVKFLKLEGIEEFTYLSSTGYLKVDESRLMLSQVEFEELKT